MKNVVSIFLVAFLVVGGGWVAAQEAADTFIVQGIPADLEAAVAAAGGEVLRVHPQIGYATVRSTAPGFAARLSSAPGIAGVEQDYVVQWVPDFLGETVSVSPEASPGTDPSGAFFRECQWNMDQVDAPSAWAAGIFGDGVTVAVLDTGIDPYHNDLWTKVDMVNSVSFLPAGSSLCNELLGLPDEQTYWDFNLHGTFVASQITGNGIGLASVAPGVEIVGVKVVDCTGSGDFGTILSGLLYAADLPDVDIINMSLGFYYPKNEFQGLNAIVSRAVNYAKRQGKLVVASAGNDGANLDKNKNWIHIPSESGTATSIYATNYFDELASYSNYGVSGTWVGAPGGDGVDPDESIPGCPFDLGFQGGVAGVCSQFSIFFDCGDGATYLVGGTGTSFAAPIAAGVAALMDGNYGGMLNPAQLKTGLKKTADDLGKKGADLFYSHGRVNAGTAAEY